MFRRSSTATVADPDPRVMLLVESAAAAARATATLDEALDEVLKAVAHATGWAAGHVWLPDGNGAWRSGRLWYSADPIGLGGLRRACTEEPPAPARGHLALALHLEGTQCGDLRGLVGTPRYHAALEAGIAGAVASPVFAAGRAVAVLEWYRTSTDALDPDVVHALGHLSGVLSEIAERPVVTVPAARTYARIGEALRWVTEDGVLSRLLTT